MSATTCKAWTTRAKKRKTVHFRLGVVPESQRRVQNCQILKFPGSGSCIFSGAENHEYEGGLAEYMIEVIFEFFIDFILYNGNKKP